MSDRIGGSNLDILPHHLQIVLDILKKHVPQYEVWAFGSRAKLTARESSDLDLVVMTEKRLSIGDFGELKYDFEQSDLPFKVDVIDWAVVKNEFREIIKSQRVLLQKPAA